jgi:uncharacterized membrane protein
VNSNGCGVRPDRALRHIPLRTNGAIAPLAAILLIVAVAALGALDVAMYFSARRDLQRIVDLSASAGALSVGGAGGCVSATNSAKANAVVNGAPSADAISVSCGRWDPSTNAGPSYFVANATPMNAVQVTANRNVPYFFMAPGATHTLSATATAATANVSSFSLMSSVASLSGGALNGLLNGLVGANLNLSVASYQGLAATQVRLGDLATALGVGSVTELLNAKVTVSQLATAMASALSMHGAAASAAVSALGWIASGTTNTTPISIGAVGGTNGIIAIGLGSATEGANATISALDALLVAAEIANGTSAVNLGNALNLGALANVTAQVRVLQPAVIAVGEAGYNADGTPRTSAHSAAVRLYLRIQLLNLNLGIVNVSALNLPISIEAGAGTGVLQTAVCGASRSGSYSIVSAQPTPASICIGGDAINNMTNVTTPGTCNTPVAITSVTVNTGLLTPITLDVVVGNPATNAGLSVAIQPSGTTKLTFNGVAGDSDDYQSTNTNALGSATSGLLTQVAAQLPYAVHANLNGVPLLDAVLQVLVAPVLSLLVALLTPVLNALDALLVPVLNLLGVQIGVVTVHDLGLTCGESALVF